MKTSTIGFLAIILGAAAGVFAAPPVPTLISPALGDSGLPRSVSLTWNASAGRTYQVEYSTDLVSWFASPTGEVIAPSSTASWTDSGPPDTAALPFSVPQKFYRVFQFGFP